MMDTSSKSSRPAGKYSEKISKKNSRELISSGRAVLRNDLRKTSSEMMFDFYIVDDLKLLIVLLFDGSSVLYHSYAAYLKLLDEHQAKINLLFPGQDLNQLTQESYLKSTRPEFEALIANSPEILSRKMDLDVRQLDFSEKSLLKISRKLNQIIAESDRFYIGIEYIDLIVAYLGESIRCRVKGNWTIEDEEGTITRLEITNQHGGTHRPHWYLSEAFFDSTKKIDLSGEFKMQVIGFPPE